MHVFSNCSQGFMLHKLIELLGIFFDIPNIKSRFMREQLFSEVLEALIVIRGLIVQKTKLISDCRRLLKDLLDSLLLESAKKSNSFSRALVVFRFMGIKEDEVIWYNGFVPFTAIDKHKKCFADNSELLKNENFAQVFCVLFGICNM